MARVACIWAFANILANVLTELPVVAAAASLSSRRPAAPTISRTRSENDHVADTRRAAGPSRANRCCNGHGDSSISASSSNAAAPKSLWLGKAGRRAVRDSGVLGESDAERAVDAWRPGRMVVALRGGSSAAAVAGGGGSEERGVEAGEGRAGVVVRSMKVLVSTTKISSYVDARGEISARSDWTVGRLKEEIEKKFPGKIPASLQRLFKGTLLLPSSMTLEKASEGAEGPLSLLLDNAPPIDASKFDPDTAVPSRRDGQVEAFSACLAAQSTLQEALLASMRGDNGQDDPELSRSVKMKADFENTQALLRRTLDEVPDASGDEKEVFGFLHEALRPLAHSLDVDWIQSAQYALFVYICAQFGARGALRQGLTLMLIPMIFLAQTRRARVGLKLARNLAAEIPLLTQLFLGLLQAPGQVILSLDAAAYSRELYGPGGPKYDAASSVNMLYEYGRLPLFLSRNIFYALADGTGSGKTSDGSTMSR